MADTYEALHFWASNVFRLVDQNELLNFGGWILTLNICFRNASGDAYENSASTVCGKKESQTLGWARKFLVRLHIYKLLCLSQKKTFWSDYYYKQFVKNWGVGHLSITSSKLKNIFFQSTYLLMQYLRHKILCFEL